MNKEDKIIFSIYAAIAIVCIGCLIACIFIAKRIEDKVEEKMRSEWQTSHAIIGAVDGTSNGTLGITVRGSPAQWKTDRYSNYVNWMPVMNAVKNEMESRGASNFFFRFDYGTFTYTRSSDGTVKMLYRP